MWLGNGRVYWDYGASPAALFWGLLIWGWVFFLMGGYITNTVLREAEGIPVFFLRVFLWRVKGAERIYNWDDYFKFYLI